PHEFPANRELYRENCKFGALGSRFCSENLLCRSDILCNSLRKVTGKIFRRTGIFQTETGKIATESRTCCLMSAPSWWSQPVDATLYLRGKRWSVGWNEDFIEVLLRQRRR